MNTPASLRAKRGKCFAFADSDKNKKQIHRQSHIADTAAIHLFFLLKENFRGSENRDCSLRCSDGLGFLYYANILFAIK